MKKVKATACLILLISGPAFSQPAFPPDFPVFDSSVVARIDVTIHPDTLQWIYDHVESNIQFHADFIFRNGTINDTLQEIGFRLGGNTSRYSYKKSFNIDFNHFHQGREFYDLDKLNLNGEHNDPSVIRSRICWEWLRAFKVPAPRAAHAMVYINGSCYGLYMMVEQIDDEFVKSRFGNDDGNLFKCLYPADLRFLGNNPDLYKLYHNDRRVYALRTNEEVDDYTDLARFIAVLNNTPTAQLACKLEEVFNLQDYLKVIAMDVITGNWDGYIYNKNNFYLYHNTKTDKFEYIPYDLDNTLGIDWLGRDWGTRDIYDWAQHGNESRPLYTRLMEVPEIRDQYSFYVKQLLNLLADEDSLFYHINQIKNMISSSILSDPYYPLDYGYNYASFLNSYNQALGGHVDYGLFPFIQIRKASALQQLTLNDMKPAVKYIAHSKFKPGEDYWVRAFVEDEDPYPAVRLFYRVDWGPAEFAEMFDDGNHHDKEAGDGIYGCIRPPIALNQTFSWQVRAVDPAGNETILPCSPVVVTYQPSSNPRLFINELMADNESIIADEYGEYDDWVEIYNGDDVDVWLGDKFLTDNLSNPDKWQLPDLTLSPGEFLLIWTDGQPEQGVLHASFRINDEGEEIGIFDSESTGYFLIDSVSFGRLEDDISYGRETDGGLPWVFFTAPTPGYSNTASLVQDVITPGRGIEFYPNPVTGGWVYFDSPFTGRISDAIGRLVWKGMDVVKIDVSTLPPGLYFFTVEDGRSGKLVVP